MREKKNIKVEKMLNFDCFRNVQTLQSMNTIVTFGTP